MKRWQLTWRKIFLYLFLDILFIGQVVLCFLSYNGANMDWLLYMGWAMMVFGLLLGMMSRRAFKRKGEAPEGESWLHTTAVVDSGIYAIVRHPMYLCGIFLIIALILVSQHWLSLILGISIIVYFYVMMSMEEQSNTKKFGDDYLRYMQRVPRANLLLGVIRLARRRNKATANKRRKQWLMQF